MLRPSEKRHCRRVARKAWIESGGDISRAEEAFRAHFVGIDPETIKLLIEFAIALWQWWIERQHSEPSEVASADEPGVDLGEDE